MENLLNAKLCQACGGGCCQTLPGAAAPEDFGSTKEEQELRVREALRSGKWQLDRWEGLAILPVSQRELDDGAYFIRPTCLDNRSKRIFSYTWGGPCVFLKETGCELSAEQRPFECRMLEPLEDHKNGCKAHYSNKLTVAELWIDAGIDLEQIGRELIREQEGG